VVSQGLDLRQLLQEEIDRRIKARVIRPLRMYDGAAHPGLFSLPRYLRKQLAEEKTVITRDKPFFTY